MKQKTILSFAACLAAGTLVFAAGPVFSSTGPNPDLYGAAEHYPVGTTNTMFQRKYMVGAYSHFDSFFPIHTIAPAAQAWSFQRADPPPLITYVHAGAHYQLKDYLAHFPATGLLIAQGDQILFEGYQYARTDHDHFTSQSMAKSIVAVLAGIAVGDGAIASISDPAAKYVTELKDAAYGKVTIRDLLHMSSGMVCEGPEGDSENITIPVLATHCKPSAGPGTQFNYSASDSQLLGLIVTRATKTQLAKYAEEKIWKNIGTESTATWTVNSSAQETAYCCFNAVLRDYARFARLLAFDGSWNGKQLVPKQWLIDGTTIQDSDSQLIPNTPAPFFGYGYQVWIFPGPRRMFGLMGSNGQRIFVDPQSKLILVQTAVTENSRGPEDRETIGLWLSLVRHFGHP